MPPNIGDPALSITITLTPVCGGGEVRIITLKPGDPCLIGRASKSTIKNLAARRDNALFDCPVISREHAELRAHLWDLVQNQVTITDKGSMHGTRVNGTKLRNGQSKTLRPGDTIQFGEKVTRADSSHDGVIVVFDHEHNFSQASNTLAAHTPATKPSGVYRYPYTSDEESDYDSEDNMSILSEAGEVKEASSAKTTPEQGKAKLGSQEKPIDVDQSEKPAKMIVQDSVDVHAPVMVAESLPVAPRRPTYIDVDSDEDSINVRQRVSQIPPIKGRPRAMSYVSLDEDAEENDDMEYADDYEKDADNLSDSEASDLDHYGQPHESEYDEESDVADRRSSSPHSAREPSPELHSSGQNRPTAPPAMRSTSYVPPPAVSSSATLMRPPGSQYNSGFQFDYYSPSQPADFRRPFDFIHPSAGLPTVPSIDPPLNNTSQFGVGLNSGNPSRSQPKVSRWDQPPPFFRTEPALPYSYPSQPLKDFYAPPTDPFNYLAPSWDIEPFTEQRSSFEPLTAAESTYSAQSPKIPPPPPAAQVTGRISIPDIVEDGNEMGDDTSVAMHDNFDEMGAKMRKETNAMMEKTNAMMEKTNAMRKETNSMIEDAHAMVEQAKMADASSPFASLSTTASTATKRKADDGENMQAGPSELSVTMTGTSINTEATGFDTPTPAPKRAKTSDTTMTPTFDGSITITPATRASASSVAGSIAKYAAVASAGGAGMLAFLCSPASEKLLSWLS